MPERRPYPLENDYRPYDIRWLGESFVLLFAVVDASKTVWVIGARHSRQQPLQDALPKRAKHSA